MMARNTKESFALTFYPLSDKYKQTLEALTGPLLYISLGDLRKSGLKGLLVGLWNIRGEKIYLPFEDQFSERMYAALYLVASLTRGNKIFHIDPKLQTWQVSRFHILFPAFRFMIGSTRSILYAFLAYFQVSRLLKAEYQKPKVKSLNSVAYIKSNLWFGVKAGGSVGHIAGVINGLTEKGLQVTFISNEPPKMVNDSAEFFEVEPLPMLTLPFELNNLLYCFKLSRHVTKTISEKDFIYQRMSLFNFSGASLRKKTGKPLVLEYNGSEVWIARNWGRPLKFESLAQKIEDVCFQKSDLVVTVSEALKDDLLQKGVPSDKIVVYPNCIDPDIFDPEIVHHSVAKDLRTQLGLTEDGITVTFVGTFGKWHGVNVFAKAIFKFLEEQKDFVEKYNLKFLLVGDGQEMETVRNILEKYLSSPRIILTGIVEQAMAPYYLSVSDILVSPHVRNADGSRFFGSPTKLFEYMAMAKPVVASRLEQIGEVLKNSINISELNTNSPSSPGDQLAVLCEPGEVIELVDSIRFLAMNPDWRRALGQNARNEVVKKYTWSHHVDSILERLVQRVQF